MNEELGMDNIEQRVLLLALYKKKDDETFKDVLGVMEHSRVFDVKTGKKYLKNLKALNYITDDGFTMIGIQKAKEVEMEFKI
ncbi:MAG: hypothetical protein U9Q04_10305 [Campylobacterota bacterium]|nr:hypothetical protein [Campylobacterota bacterium]